MIVMSHLVQTHHIGEITIKDVLINLNQSIIGNLKISIRRKIRINVIILNVLNKISLHIALIYTKNMI